MRILLILIIVSFYAFTLVKPDEKVQDQKTCETVKFPGGDTAFGTFVYSNLDSKILTKYPDLKGTVYIEFIVDTTGKIISTEVKANKLNIPDSSKIIKEIRRVLLTSPKWEFYDLVNDSYHDEKEKEDGIIEFDNNLPVDGHLSIEETIDENNFKNNRSEKCKKLKARLIFPFKFPIPDFFLEPKK